jgi:hypothetical protein
MLILNALSAVFMVPSWVLIFKPAFITSAHYDEDGILVTEGESQTSENAQVTGNAQIVKQSLPAM